MAEKLNLPRVEVYSVATFYSMEFLGKPLSEKARKLLHTTYTKRSRY